jgi:hypothetical protein
MPRMSFRLAPITAVPQPVIEAVVFAPHSP